MPRGRKSLDIPESDIIQTDEESGSIPFFLIDDEYGISGNYRDYSLVVKKRTTRAATIDDCEDYNEKYISYILWSSVAYCSNLKSIFECYVKIKGLSKSKKLRKSQDYQELIHIYEDIYSHIKIAFQYENLPLKIEKICDLTDEEYKIRNKIDILNDQYALLLRKSNELEKLIKEKRSMIIKEMEPKKHRIKLEK